MPLKRCVSHSWPGNIRELENVLERTILFCSGPQIQHSDLPDELCTASAAAQPESASTALEGTADSDGVGTKDGVPGEAVSLKDAVRAETNRVEKELIAHALGETAGNVTQAAKLLKISRKSLQMKMKDFGLRDRVRDGESGN